MNDQSPPPLDWISAAAELLELVPKSYFERIDPVAIFGRSAPLEIDVGCGEGAFLLAMAALHPDRDFLAIERQLGRVHTVCRGAARERLTNVRVARIESLYAVQHLLPPSSVAAAHVLFPDPWPKRHHQPRRLIQEEFLRALHTVLHPGGELRVKTDDQPYFIWMEKAFARLPALFERVEWLDDSAYPTTDFERKFVGQGLPIYRARLRKI